MGPKKPVRIGLIKKSNKESDDFSDEGDELMSQAVSVADETLPPLSKSALEDVELLCQCQILRQKTFLLMI